MGPEKWKLAKRKRDQMLTPTVINGFFVCIRRLVSGAKIANREQYQESLKGLDTFHFSRYKSSGWKALGDALYDRFFAK
jgi:hypothetical protein